MSATVLDVIMLFGDSITQSGWQAQGFGQRLADAYVRKLDVINRGLFGYNTNSAFPVLQRTLATQAQQQHVPKVRILTIWLGANDACIQPSVHHVPLPQYSDNLKRMVGLVSSPTSPQYAPATRVILLTPPPINMHQLGPAPGRTFEATQAYAEAAKKVGSDVNVEVVDVWTALWEAAGKQQRALSKYLVDGLHLNGAGYTVVYDALIKKIADKFPDLHYNKLPDVLN